MMSLFPIHKYKVVYCLNFFFLPNSVIPNVMTASSDGGDGWWLHMSAERRARERELFQKLVTHFYLVRSSTTGGATCVVSTYFALLRFASGSCTW